MDTMRRRAAPLDMTGDEIRDAGHALVEAVASFLDGLRDRPVTRDESPGALRALLPPDEVPPRGRPAGELLAEVAPLLFDHSLFNGHPRFFGYITSSAAPIGVLADLLAASVNPNLGAWELSPLATEIEKQAVRWIASLLGFPVTAGGLFVSGGNAANFHAFLAARAAKAPWDARADGLPAGRGRLLAYASAETHTWLQKAADLFGHGTTAVRELPVDRDSRADVSGLSERVRADRAAGDHPFLLIATTGTVSTGSVDPVGAMARIAREEGLWLHVDGAYGGFAACLPDASDDLRAIGLADSVAVDPHKWLYSPLEAGCVLVRDPEALERAFSYTPPYYSFDRDEEPRTNFYAHGMQNSRGFRALKTWLGLRQAGREGVARAIADDVRLARTMAEALAAHPEIEVGSCALSIVTFRHVPRELAGPRTASDEEALDALNEEVLARVKRSGEAFFSNAVLRGRAFLRACIVNFRTTEADVLAVPAIVARHGRAAWEAMRG